MGLNPSVDEGWRGGRGTTTSSLCELSAVAPAVGETGSAGVGEGDPATVPGAGCQQASVMWFTLPQFLRKNQAHSVRSWENKPAALVAPIPNLQPGCMSGVQPGKGVCTLMNPSCQVVDRVSLNQTFILSIMPSKSSFGNGEIVTRVGGCSVKAVCAGCGVGCAGRGGAGHDCGVCGGVSLGLAACGWRGLAAGVTLETAGVGDAMFFATAGVEDPPAAAAAAGDCGAGLVREGAGAVGEGVGVGSGTRGRL